MTEQHDHADDVAWGTGSVDDKVKLEDWRLSEKTEGGKLVRVVLGWCPECDGPAAEVVRRKVDPGALRTASEDDDTVPVRRVRVVCNGCGHNHKDNTQGCGRQWSVPWNLLKLAGS